MRNKPVVLGFILFTLNAPAAAQTSAPADRDRENKAPEVEEANAEYRVRSLPADTFKPSEEISEDFPVPFPVDI